MTHIPSPPRNPAHQPGTGKLPIPMGQLSVWQESTRDSRLVNMNKEAPLPPDVVDVVVIGSGVSGAVTSYSLLQSGDKGIRVVCLEAREACSGASGRNAGHCRPDTYRGFTAFEKKLGAEQALQVLESERVVFDRVDAFVKEHKIDCEWTPRPTYDTALSSAFNTYAATALESVKALGAAQDVEVLEGEASRKETRAAGAFGAFKWKAATLNPSKLTYGIHELNLTKPGYQLFTWAPVSSVTPGADGIWEVNTARGTVKAKKVVHCTNGYAASVLPEMASLITPVRAQATKLPPPPAGSDKFPSLEGSYSLRVMADSFYSVAPRPDSSIVLGGSRIWENQPPWLKNFQVDTVDDSVPCPYATANFIDTFAKVFPEAGYEPGVDGKGVESAWTGIIGMTPDNVPWVGALPGKPGQFIHAGFCGHGMARIFLTAPALADMVLGGSWSADVPTAFQITEERILRIKTAVAATAFAALKVAEKELPVPKTDEAAMVAPTPVA